jgi:hypothetical protein
VKPSLSHRIHQIMLRSEAAKTDKRAAFQELLRQIGPNERATAEINPDTFARTWRRHKKRF